MYPHTFNPESVSRFRVQRCTESDMAISSRCRPCRNEEASGYWDAANSEQDSFFVASRRRAVVFISVEIVNEQMSLFQIVLYTPGVLNDMYSPRQKRTRRRRVVNAMLSGDRSNTSSFFLTNTIALSSMMRTLIVASCCGDDGITKSDAPTCTGTKGRQTKGTMTSIL